MIKDLKAYKNTQVHWGKSQTEIIKLLEKYDIKETRFTNLGYKTMKKHGMVMEEDTCALMIEFFKQVEVSSGVGGTVPIRIIIPSIPEEEQYKNQAYRIIYWYLKNKFESVATGLIEFEQEFMPHIALGKGQGIGNVWNLFKDKVLPSIMSGKSADIALLEEPKKDN